MSFEPSKFDLRKPLSQSSEFLYTVRHWNTRISLESDLVASDMVAQGGKPVSYCPSAADVTISGISSAWDQLLSEGTRTFSTIGDIR